jgi:hypothetical protein
VPSTHIPKWESQKNNVQKSDIKSALKKHQKKHHNSPANHHNFTTKNHHDSTQISTTPLKNISKQASFPAQPAEKKTQLPNY